MTLSTKAAAAVWLLAPFCEAFAPSSSPSSPWLPQFHQQQHHHPHHPYHAEGRPRAGTSYGWGKTTMRYTPMVDRVKDDEPSEEAQPQPPAGQSDSVVRFLDRPEQG